MKRTPSVSGYFNAKCCIAFFGIVLFLFFATPLSAQNDCDIYTINLAQENYNSGNFFQAIEMLDACLLKFENDQQKVLAHKIMALCYLELEEMDNARLSIQKLLFHAPAFEAEITDPPRFIQLVEQIKTGGALQISSVSKKAENIYEAPATVTVITEEDILTRGYTNIEAVFDDLPGFDISRTRGINFSNLYQRGYRSNNTERTLFLIDGVEENSLWSNTAFISRQYSLSNVKRIEVVYGPASTMYGANAFVGVVNVITKEPQSLLKQRHFGLSADAGYGTYNSRYADVSMVTGMKDISLMITGRVYATDGMDLTNYPEFNYNPSDYDTVDYRSMLSVANPGEEFNASPYYTVTPDSAILNDAGLEAVRNFDKQALDTELNGQPVGYSNNALYWLLNVKLRVARLTASLQTWKYFQPQANTFNDNNEAGRENGSQWVPEETFFYLNYDKDITPRLSISNFSIFRLTEVDPETAAVFLLNYSNGALGTSSLLNNTEPFWITKYYYQLSRQFRNEVKLNYSYRNFEIIGGIEGRISDVQGDYRTTTRADTSAMEAGTSVGDTLPGGNNYLIRDFGAYTQGSYRFTNWLKITLGGRFDYNQIRSDGGYGWVFNPRVAVVASPGDYIFKVIYASAFQNASNWTKYSVSDDRLPNPKLKPEEVDNIELSAFRQINAFLDVGLSYYYAVYDGVVGTKTFTVNGRTYQRNEAIGEQQIQGLQATMNLRFDNYSVWGNYTFCSPKSREVDSEGNLTDNILDIADIAQHQFNIGGNIEFFERLQLHLRTNYVGKRRVGEGTTVSSNPGTFPAYMIFNGTVTYRDALLPGMNLQLICNNIFNAEYMHPGIRSASGGFYSYRTPQYGRNFMLRLVYDF